MFDGAAAQSIGFFMNTNALGLQLLAEFGLKPLQWDLGGFCLNHRLQREMPVYSAQKEFRNRLAPTNSSFCSSRETPASALAGQTDSPEPIGFGYSPL